MKELTDEEFKVAPQIIQFLYLAKVYKVDMWYDLVLEAFNLHPEYFRNGEDKVDVLFLIDDTFKDVEPRVIAYFPTKRYDDVYGNMYGYVPHRGFTCLGISYVKDLKEATLEQYQELLDILKQRVLVLNILNKS